LKLGIEVVSLQENICHLKIMRLLSKTWQNVLKLYIWQLYLHTINAQGMHTF